MRVCCAIELFILSSLLVGCQSLTPPPLENQAVRAVSFSLSIEARQNGAVEGRPSFLSGDEMEFLGPFREAVEGLWRDFRADSDILFPGAQVRGPDTVEETSPYGNATWAPMDRNSFLPVRARSFVWPTGFRFADNDADHRVQLNAAFPGEWLVWVELQGGASDAVTPGESAFGRAPTRGKLTVLVTLVDPQGRVAWTRELRGLSELTVPRAGGRIARERYPDLFRSALQDALKGAR